jgi:hypothetical protein
LDGYDIDQLIILAVVLDMVVKPGTKSKGDL